MIEKHTIDEFATLDTCCLSDAMDRIGIPCGLKGIKPIVAGKKICGPAFTVHYVPCGIKKGTVGDFLDDVAAGEVVVIDNGGRDYCTVWGDLMAITATRNRIGGTVIDGVCRDVPIIRELGYPIFTKGCYMVTGKDRVEVDAVNVPVAVSGIQVKPGDLIIGDDTGVIVIPAEKALEVLAVAKEIAQKELWMEREIGEGKTLREARANVKYHNLQTHTE